LNKNRQHTIGRSITLSGVGIHTGEHANLVFKPAPPGQGILFVRTDIPGSPSVPADIDLVVDVSRGTTVENGKARVQTVEHLLAACCGLGIDNLTVETDRRELPVGDGSADFYTRALIEAGTVEQDAEREYFTPPEAVYLNESGTELAVIPSDRFSISATIHYGDRMPGSQFISISPDRESFIKNISAARTYCFESEINELKKRGLGMGGSLENTIVIGEKEITNTTLRFFDEFVRHKILDLMGDLYLLGAPLRAAVIANRCGHAANVELARRLRKARRRSLPAPPPGARTIELPELIRILPHRYPFLLVDRVFMEPSGKTAHGVKNITVNEPYFREHYPEDPVLPRVLVMEFMAQSSAVMLLSGSDDDKKLAYFIIIEKAVFFGDVRPPAAIRSRVRLKRAREKGGRVEGECYCGDKKIAEAVFMFAIVER